MKKTAFPHVSTPNGGFDAFLELFKFDYANPHVTDRWDEIYSMYARKYGTPFDIDAQQKAQEWDNWKNFVRSWWQENKDKKLNRTTPGASEDHKIASAIPNAWYSGVEIPAYFIDRSGHIQLRRISRPGNLPTKEMPTIEDIIPQDIDSEQSRWDENASNTEQWYDQKEEVLARAWIRKVCAKIV